MLYLNDKYIPLTNFINIASIGAAAVTGKVTGVACKIKSVAPHVLYIHCINHRQHQPANNIVGDILQAFNTVINAINFVKSNSVKVSLSNSEKIKNSKLYCFMEN